MSNGSCIVGIPKEVKTREGRVGMTPSGVQRIVGRGARVFVERGAGLLSKFSDSDYESAGALLVDGPKQIWSESNLVVKVKEPVPSEYPHLAELRGRGLFTYLHLAGVDKGLTLDLLSHRIAAIAYETVSETVGGKTVFPLLVPMSHIAGIQSARGALLRHPKENYAMLNAVVIGGGNVGEAALQHFLANGIGPISVFESHGPRIHELCDKYANDKGVITFPLSALDGSLGREILRTADIVICGPMSPGGKEAPIVLTARKHFRYMKRGAYIADVSIDQGGSTEWTRGHPTKPGETFTRGSRGLVFSSVANIPGSTVPDEATLALTDVTLPYIELIVHRFMFGGSMYGVLNGFPALLSGLQTFNGYLTNEHVALKHGLEERYRSVHELL